MNILWLSWKDITNPEAGGAEIVGEQHAKSWTAAGHKIHWVSINYPGSTQFTTKAGIEYEHVGQRWMWFLGLIHIAYWYKWETKWKNEYDIVIDEIHGPPLLTPLYVKKPKLVVIHEVAGTIWAKTIPFPLSTIMQYIIEPVLFQAYKHTQIMTVAQTTADELIKMGIPKDNISVIISGVSIPDKINTPSKESTPTIIFLSQLRPMKGLDRVYAAFKKVQKSIPNVKLWIVGDDTLPYGKQIKQTILSEQTNETAVFWGKVTEEQKFDLLSRAHVLVHGSYKEGWGLVVIEANAVGTPAVVFDAAGLRNSVNNNSTGFVVANEEEFVQKVTELLTNHEEYKQFQTNATNWSNQFTWKNATEKSLSLLSTLKNL